MRAFWWGFTLAEVLITLTIIGIIAALTVPTLMNKVQDHGFRSAFLKNYAIIKNAYAKSMSDGVPFWDPIDKAGNEYIINPEFRKDLNLIKDYFKVQKGPYYGNWGGGASTLSYFYPGANWNKPPFKYLSGQSFSQFMENGSALTFQLVDGTILCFRSGGGYAYVIMIDVNGKKGPNTYGRDVYWVQAAWDKTLGRFEIHPYGDPHTGGTAKAADGIIQDVASDCKLNSTGKTCAYEIIKNKSFVIPKS